MALAKAQVIATRKRNEMMAEKRILLAGDDDIK